MYLTLGEGFGQTLLCKKSAMLFVFPTDFDAACVGFESVWNYRDTPTSLIFLEVLQSDTSHLINCLWLQGALLC